MKKQKISFGILIVIGCLAFVYSKQFSKSGFSFGPFTSIDKSIDKTVAKRQLPQNPVSYLVNDDKRIKALHLPTINNKLPSGLSIPDQWTSEVNNKSDRFVLVASKNSPIYARPDLNALKIAELPLSTRVRVNFKLLHFVESRDHNQWVFVSTPDNLFPIGWITENHIVYKSQFSRFNPLNEAQFSFQKGELSAAIQVEKDGRFISNWEAHGEGIHLRGSQKGYIYSYNDLVWLRKETPDRHFEFFRVENDQIKHEVLYKKEELNIKE